MSCMYRVTDNDVAHGHAVAFEDAHDIVHRGSDLGLDVAPHDRPRGWIVGDLSRHEQQIAVAHGLGVAIERAASMTSARSSCASAAADGSSV